MPRHRSQSQNDIAHRQNTTIGGVHLKYKVRSVIVIRVDLHTIIMVLVRDCNRRSMVCAEVYRILAHIEIGDLVASFETSTEVSEIKLEDIAASTVIGASAASQDIAARATNERF